MPGHFAKGNAAAKETIDRISGSGVFARDPDSLITFTKHEEEDAYTIEMVLRNLPPVKPFVVRWQWPLFRREESLDPAHLKTAATSPIKYTQKMVLQSLGNDRLTSAELEARCREDHGMSRGKFYELLKPLEEGEKIQKSRIDRKWQQIRPKSSRQNHE